MIKLIGVVLVSASLLACAGNKVERTEVESDGTEVTTKSPTKVYITDRLIADANMCRGQAVSLLEREKAVGDNLSEEAIVALDSNNQGTAIVANLSNNILRVFYDLVPKPEDQFISCMRPVLAQIESVKARDVASKNMWGSIVRSGVQLVTGYLIVDAVSGAITSIAANSGDTVNIGNRTSSVGAGGSGDGGGSSSSSGETNFNGDIEFYTGNGHKIKAGDSSSVVGDNPEQSPSIESGLQGDFQPNDDDGNNNQAGLIPGL